MPHHINQHRLLKGLKLHPQQIQPDKTLIWQTYLQEVIKKFIQSLSRQVTTSFPDYRQHQLVVVVLMLVPRIRTRTSPFSCHSLATLAPAIHLIWFKLHIPWLVVGCSADKKLLLTKTLFTPAEQDSQNRYWETNETHLHTIPVLPADAKTQNCRHHLSN